MITAASANSGSLSVTCGMCSAPSARDDHQGKVAGKYILSNFEGKKVAIIHDKTAYGQSLADATRRAMTKGGMKGRCCTRPSTRR